MYGHRLPEDVHFILNKYEANYMILEDSICLSPRIGCRLPDIIDLDNGIVSMIIIGTDHSCPDLFDQQPY